MGLAVEISARAKDDLRQQYEWYVQHANAVVAERYLTALDSTVKRVCEFPNLGQSRKFRHRSLAGIRSFTLERPFAVHLVFYRENPSMIFIERVLHGARDLPQRLVE